MVTLHRMHRERHYVRRDLQYTPSSVGRREACGGGVLDSYQVSYFEDLRV